MSDFISFGRQTCSLHCLHREKNTLNQSRLRHTVHSTHTRNGHVKEKEKSDRCRFLLSVFYCWMRTITLSICLRHTKQRTKGKCCCCFFKNLQCTQCVLHHATWDGDLTDCLTTTQKMCMCLLDIRSNIFLFIVSFFFAQAAWGLIYGLKVALYSRWPCDGE